MQQAARVSDFTAFMYLGELIEFDTTQQDVHHAERPTHAGLHHRPLRLIARSPARMKQMAMTEHTAKAFDADLQELTRMVAEMGGLAERQIADAVDALARRDADRAQRVVAGDPEHRRAAARDRGEGGADHRPPPADGGRPARDRRRAAHRQRSRADRRPRQEHRQARAGARRRVPSAQADPRRRAHGRAGARPAQGRARRLCRARSREGAGGVERRRGDRRHLHLAVPRAADLHDGRSAQHHVLHPSAVLRQEHRAHRRSRHQHRRDRLLHDRGPRRSPTSGRRATPPAFATLAAEK